MTWLSAVGRELLGLVVDDTRLAVLIAVWLLLTGLIVPRVRLADGVAGAIVFAGLAAILINSVVRGARAK